jgi:hypothetical protein
LIPKLEKEQFPPPDGPAPAEPPAKPVELPEIEVETPAPPFPPTSGEVKLLPTAPAPPPPPPAPPPAGV